MPKNVKILPAKWPAYFLYNGAKKGGGGDLLTCDILFSSDELEFYI